MPTFTTIILLAVVKLVVLQDHELSERKHGAVISNENYRSNISIAVNSSVEYIIHFPDSRPEYSYTVVTWSEKADYNYPVFVMVRQQKELISWTIPLAVNSGKGTSWFYNISRILCYSKISEGTTDNLSLESKGISKPLSMSIYTTSEASIPVAVRVEEEKRFFVKENKNYSFLISPSQPKFFYFKFPNYLDAVTVLIDSHDDTCLTASVQNASCPVFDLNQYIAYAGKYQTIDTKGGFIVHENEFPNGFFVVFVVKGDDFDCIQKSRITDRRILRVKTIRRSSEVSFKIKPGLSKSDYENAIVVTVSGIVIFYLIFILASLACYWVEKPRTEVLYHTLRDGQNTMEVNNCGTGQGNTAGFNDLSDSDTSSGNGQNMVEENNDRTAPENDGSSNHLAGENAANVPSQVGANVPSQIGAKVNNGGTGQGNAASLNDVSDSDTRSGNGQNMVEGNNDRTAPENDGSLNHLPIGNGANVPSHDTGEFPKTVSDLTRKTSEVFNRESRFYMWLVIIMGIVYSVPTLQLAITQLMMVHYTGNMDLCYYNFLCAHPLSKIIDFNHLFSNIPYLFAGVSFSIITYLKQEIIIVNENCGVMQHYGMYYALAVSVMMVGILSASYHICPNNSNFQYDTTFMYVTLILYIVKLYQNRHPDIGASAYVTFAVLAVGILIVLVGILHGSSVFWGLFTAAYILVWLYLSRYLYYFHDPPNPLNPIEYITTAILGDTNFWQALKPKNPGRCILIVVATILNVTGAIGGMFYFHRPGYDFPTFLLVLLGGNAIIYTVAYMIMKWYAHGEFSWKLSWKAIIYTILSLVTWISAYNFFNYHSSDSSVPASKSREVNSECRISFYDNHDIWHILSAMALFFSCMLLLSLDDDRILTPRENIAIF